jgi:hypothetical protein
LSYTLFFRRYAPFESFGGGFEGDARSVASTNLSDTARTIGKVQFAPGMIGVVIGESSGTSFVGVGALIQNILGRHTSKVTSSVSVSTKSLDCVRFTAQTAGANPMIPGAPTIDTFIDFHVAFSNTSVVFQGTVRGDNFPNAEVFVTDSQGCALMLLDFSTSGGQTTGPIIRLAGSHANQKIGEFNYRVSLSANQCFVASSLSGQQTAFP